MALDEVPCMMSTRFPSAAMLAVIGFVATTPAIAHDRKAAGPDAAEAAFGKGAKAVSLTDRELAGESGDGDGKIRNEEIDGTPNTLAGRSATSEVGGSINLRDVPGVVIGQPLPPIHQRH